MAGGMISARGVPLRDRQVTPAPDVPRSRTRHCWVTGPAEDPGPWPGLVLEWRRGSSGWSALVVYVITNEPAVTTIQTWIPPEHLRPA